MFTFTSFCQRIILKPFLNAENSKLQMILAEADDVFQPRYISNESEYVDRNDLDVLHVA